MDGYCGKLLKVDLTSGRCWEEALNPDYARRYVGGSGLAARYLAGLVSGNTDPLGPDNPLIFMAGPLVGTEMPSSGRYSVCALSPLTGIWGEANSGGFFGPELRFCGYDGLIILGRAAEPAWLGLVNGRVELREASALWGKDIYATQEALREELSEPKARVACIGAAGENQVKMAAVMNDHGRAAARTGMGAVMGSKNLKAIAVKGCGRIELADPQGMKRLVRDLIAKKDEDMAALAMRLAGTAGYLNMGMMYGDLPCRNYSLGEWEPADQLSGVRLVTEFQNRNTGCYRCPIACGRETRAPAYGVKKADGPEYETLGALGTLLMVSDMETAIYTGHLCNLHGLDTISTGATLALACELFERGILTAADTGGLELRFGDGEGLPGWIERIARREGFGDVLAEGSAALAERCGVPELAVTVNRLEAPMHDPRAFLAMAVTYALSPRGACHMQGDMYGVDAGQGPAVELGIVPGDRFDDSPEKGRIAARQMAWRNLYNSMIVCQFQNPGVAPILEALNAATGWGLQAGDLLDLGKRILTLKRVINFRRGLTAANDRLPERLLESLKEGGTEGHVPAVQSLLQGAYAELGWDGESGYPTPQALETLGL